MSDIGWSNTKGKYKYFVSLTNKDTRDYIARIALNADNKISAISKVRRKYGNKYKYGAWRME